MKGTVAPDTITRLVWPNLDNLRLTTIVTFLVSYNCQFWKIPLSKFASSIWKSPLLVLASFDKFKTKLLSIQREELEIALPCSQIHARWIVMKIILIWWCLCLLPIAKFSCYNMVFSNFGFSPCPILIVMQYATLSTSVHNLHQAYVLH